MGAPGGHLEAAAGPCIATVIGAMQSVPLSGRPSLSRPMWTCFRRFGRCPRGSVRPWSCTTTRTCRSRTSPSFSAARRPAPRCTCIVAGPACGLFCGRGLAMDDESRMRRVLQQEAGSVVPDVSEAVQRVHGLAHRRTARRRGAVAIAAAAAAVTAVAGLGGALATLHRAAPTPATSDLSKVTLSIVKERSDGDLGIGRALSVAVGAHGHVYVTDSSQHVTELSADLRRLRSWGGHGAAIGRFRLIQGSIAVGPRGQVYVSDAGNFRVQEFTSTGKFVGQMASFGTGPGQFTWPFDLAVDPGGNVYVADDRAQTLTKLTPSGRQVWRRGGPRSGDRSTPPGAPAPLRVRPVRAPAHRERRRRGGPP